MMYFPDEQNRGRADEVGKNHMVPIRTFYVSPIEKHITEDKIRKYFGDFGEVESVEIHANKSFQSCFVQFKDVASANALNAWFDNSCHRQHRIEDCWVDVREAHLFWQPDFQRESLGPLWMPPDQDSASHILNALDDDCLREVFNYLNAIDLTNAAEACVRFNQQAKDAFAQKYKHLDLPPHHWGTEEIKENTVGCLLRNFGSTIQSLDVERYELPSGTDSNSLHMIATHCTQLKKLKLSHFEMTTPIKIDVQPLFKMLQQLYMSGCRSSDNMENLLANCDELKVLRVEYCDFDASVIQRKFEKLEEFYLSNINCDKNGLNRFIDMNSSLLKLSIIMDNLLLSPEMAPMISQGLPNLLELELKTDYVDDAFFQNLRKFNSLKVLKFNMNGLSAAMLLKNLVENETSIEHLEVSKAKIDADAIEYISRMKSLTIIDLTLVESKFTDEHLIKLATDLPNLQELHLTESKSFDSDPNSLDEVSTIGLKKMLLRAHKLTLLKLTSVYSVSIDADDYKAMLKTVESRPEKVKLLIEITSDGNKVKVPDEVLATNREIFYINEHIEDDDDSDNPWNPDLHLDFYDNSDYDDYYDRTLHMNDYDSPDDYDDSDNFFNFDKDSNPDSDWSYRMRTDY